MARIAVCQVFCRAVTRILPTTISAIVVFMPVFWVTAQDLPGNAQNGRRIYEQSCARYHGINEAGDGRVGDTGV